MFEHQEDVQETLKRLRREQILEAAGRVFAEKGYHSAKMRDIASAAGVSNGTVYNYFASKEELLQALLHRLNETEQRSAQFSGEGGRSLPELMEKLLAHRFGFLGEHAEIFRAVLPVLLSMPSLRENYQKEVLAPSFAMADGWLEGMMEAGVLKRADSSMVGRLLAAQALGLLMIRLLGDEPTCERWEDFPALVTQVFCDGLRDVKREESCDE